MRGIEIKKERTFKCTDEQWEDMQKIADKMDITVSELIRRRVLKNPITVHAVKHDGVKSCVVHFDY